MDKYYVDCRTYEVVKNLDTGFLAPECYYEYKKGSDSETIIESWCVEGGNIVDLSYSILEKKYDINFINTQRNNLFEKNNIKPLFLKSYTVPKEWFEKETKE